jgi:hypothetical protein
MHEIKDVFDAIKLIKKHLGTSNLYYKYLIKYSYEKNPKYFWGFLRNTIQVYPSLFNHRLLAKLKNGFIRSTYGCNYYLKNSGMLGIFEEGDLRIFYANDIRHGAVANSLKLYIDGERVAATHLRHL